MGPFRRALIAGLAIAIASLALPQPASAAFHFIYVKEVFASYPAQPDVQYVELQAFFGGQNFVDGHSVKVYGPTGGTPTTFTFDDNVLGGADQMTILLATPAAQTLFDVDADFDMTSAPINRAGGAVCWDGAPDCMSWGTFSGTTSPSSGTPFNDVVSGVGMPRGRALERRTDLDGAPSTLGSADNRPNSSDDFRVAFPTPRNNAGVTGAPPAQISPIPTITGDPGTLTTDTTPTFTFSVTTGDPPGTGTECNTNLDTTLEANWQECTSPFTTPTLPQGSNKFSVRALDYLGVPVPGPDTHTFTVDSVAPDTTITPFPNNVTSDTTPAISFTANETATFRCRIDSELFDDFEACASGQEFGPLSLGQHTIDVRATDQAGNVENPHASYTFTVATPDLTSPMVSIIKPVHGKTYVAKKLRTLSGTATDPPGAKGAAVTGVSEVVLTLRQQMKNGSCNWWDGAAFVAGACAAPTSFDADDLTWTYRLSSKLKPSAGTSTKIAQLHAVRDSQRRGWEHRDRGIDVRDQAVAPLAWRTKHAVESPDVARGLHPLSA